VSTPTRIAAVGNPRRINCVQLFQGRRHGQGHFHGLLRIGINFLSGISGNGHSNVARIASPMYS
jgi:hypothetical protein